MKKEIEEKKDDKEKINEKKSLLKRKNKHIKKNREIKDKVGKEKVASFSIVEVIIIILITGLIVSLCSGLIVYNNYGKISQISDKSTSDELGDFVESYNHILNSYVKDVNKKELIDAAIEGMYNYLNDSYSIYVDENTTENIQERLEGEYEGIGIEITMNTSNKIVISRIFTNTPAEKAGLKAGDIITKLDGESLEGKDSSYLSNLIKNSVKADFKISYIREEKEYEVNVTREKVLIDSVSSNEYDSVGYIKLETFSATTSSLVKEKIDSFSNNIKSIIVDVRNNTGGYLSAAYSTASLFVNKGDIVYQLKDKNGIITKKESTSKPIRSFDKIIILTNSTSASASEILASALKDNLNATLVGTTTYGKGTVQETSPLSSGAMVKYTTAYWLTPNGNSINEIGLIPDVSVTDDINTENDEQLEKAIEIAK